MKFTTTTPFNAAIALSALVAFGQAESLRGGPPSAVSSLVPSVVPSGREFLYGGAYQSTVWGPNDCYHVDRYMTNDIYSDGCEISYVQYKYFNGGKFYAGGQETDTGCPREEYLEVEIEGEICDDGQPGNCNIKVHMEDGSTVTCNKCSHNTQNYFTMDDCSNLGDIFPPGSQEIVLFYDTDGGYTTSKTEFLLLSRDEDRCSHPCVPESVASVASLFPSLAPNPKQIISPDLALHGHVTVSSTYQDWELYDAWHLVDGDSGSRWTSAYSDNQKIDIDLGGSFLVDMVRLRWETAHAESYELLLSLDGDNWAIVESNDNSAGGIEEITFDSQQARFVRLNLLKRATGYGFSLWDFEVYKAQKPLQQANVVPSVDLPSPTTPNLADFGTNSDAVSASTVYKNWDIYQIGHIVDGDSGTRWASERHDNQKIYIDLGQAHSINRIRIGWEAAHAKSYELWLSEDGSDWTTVYSTDNCKGGLEDLAFASQQARYIHLNLLTQATKLGFSIWDLEVYGPQQSGSVASNDRTIGSSLGKGQNMDRASSTKAATTCLKKGVICWDSPQADRNPCNTCCNGYESIETPSWAGKCQ